MIRRKMVARSPDEFERLIAEAQSQKFSGWDFSWLRNRLVEETPPWNYKRQVAKEFPKIKSLLDLGTGGGELLSSLGQLPSRTFATEGYSPNSVIARDRLKPLRVDVIRTYSEDNTNRPQVGALPFRTESLDMIIDRHESFVPSEVYRVLKRGGIFLTQQAGSSNYPELNEFLGASNVEALWDLRVARQQISEAGLRVTAGREARLNSRFRDVGAVIFFLLAVPWQLEGFVVGRYLDKLRELHGLIVRTGSFRVTARRFYLRCVK
ncbi:MAG TPA: SAM-dependent methyltransferase [Candidatus Bathyarchaeia archaeon]|nr:SAM-dependent methyltransferase [Candidatus Bathyarchaeia archaeon]